METSAVAHVVNVDPALIMAGDNIRFGLKKDRVASMAESIMAAGRVINAVEVEKLNPAVDGKQYSLVDGFYRLAAITELNKSGAGLTIPVSIITVSDRQSRIRRQLSENLDREDMSPMDRANAIQEALDAGIPKIEVRTMFGTAKKGKREPMSNSLMNILLSFLEFPKSIQNDIHSGIVGVKAGYAISKIDDEDKKERDRKRLEIVAECKADLEKQAEAEEKLEEKTLKAEAREAEKEEREQARLGAEKEAREKLEKAQADLEAAKADARAKSDAALAKYTEKANLPLTATAEEKKKADEAHKAADKDMKAAQQKVRDSQNAVIKATPKPKTETAEKTPVQSAVDGAKKLADAKAAVKKKTVTDTAITKKAQEKGASTGPVPLNAPQIRQAVSELCLPGSYPKVRQIAQVWSDVVEGKLTPQMALTALALITGEKKAK